MADICEHCSQEKEVYMKTGEFRDGKRGEVYLCYDCLLKFEQSEAWFETTRGFVKNAPANSQANGTQMNSSANWTEIAKTINIIALIGVCILGLVLGAVLGDAMSYEDGAGLVGSIIGGIAGFLIGGVIVSFSMVIIEISQKLSAILDELKRK